MNLIQQGQVDLEHDEEVGFELISTDDIDDIGVREIIRRIRSRVGDGFEELSDAKGRGGAQDSRIVFVDYSVESAACFLPRMTT